MCVCVCGGGGGCVKRLTMEWQTEKKEFSIAQNIPQISLWSLVNISIQWKNVKVLKASEWTFIMTTAPLESAVSLFTSSLVITWRAQTTTGNWILWREKTHTHHSVAFCVWQGFKTASALRQCTFEQIKLAVRSQDHSKPHRPIIELCEKQTCFWFDLFHYLENMLGLILWCFTILCNNNLIWNHTIFVKNKRTKERKKYRMQTPLHFFKY